jgi:GH25 family lysozyme M1 (1,4-beta-N-acetylmuramidase)
MIDLEANGSEECWGISTSEMVTFIRDFVNTYHSKTSRYPMIYCTASWWDTCTGSNKDFGSTCPLVLAQWSDKVTTMPAGWSYQSFWQFADSGKFPGDQDSWNGDAAGLSKMALGS